MWPAGQMIFSLSVELTRSLSGSLWAARNEVVVAGHQVQQRAGYLAQVDDVPAQRHPVFRQQVLLEEVFRKLAIDLAGHRDVVVEPGFHMEIVIDEFVPVDVFHQVDGLFDQVGDRLQHEKGRLEKRRRGCCPWYRRTYRRRSNVDRSTD